MKRASPAATPDSIDFPPPALPPPHLKKKTRELPNLSDCHCCNRRINVTNPKNRLQILSSEWRIVLLCKCCYNLVESSQCCSYCLSRFSSSPIEAYHQCNRCRRRVHKACASKFSVDLINSGCCRSISDEFSVCFDCWVPRLLEKDYKARVLGSVTAKSKAVKVSCGLANSLGSSGVCDSQELGRGEDVLIDAHVVAQKKVGAAKETKKKAIEKEMVAKKAAVLASNVLGLVAVDKNGGNKQGSVVDEDAQLAFRLHRAMNSSPRISRNSCLLNTHCVNVPEVNGCSDGLGPRAPPEPSCSSKPAHFGGDERNGMSGTRRDGEKKCPRTQDEKQGGVLDGCLITYCRKGRASSKVKGREEPDCTQKTFSTGSSDGSSGDGRLKEESDCPLRTYRRRLSKVKRRKLDRAHCSKTYSRRQSVISHYKNKLITGTLGSYKLDNGSLAPAIALKSCEESRAFSSTS